MKALSGHALKVTAYPNTIRKAKARSIPLVLATDWSVRRPRGYSGYMRVATGTEPLVSNSSKQTRHLPPAPAIWNDTNISAKRALLKR